MTSWHDDNTAWAELAVAFREQRLAVEAAELRDLGRMLHEHASRAMGFIEQLGAVLSRGVERYNDFVGSYQRNLEPTLRKFEAAGVKGARDLPELNDVTVRPRALTGNGRPADDSAA